MYRIIIEKYKNLSVQIKATFWFLICAFLEKGVSVITTPIYTRLFNIAEYGKYSIFNSWLSILSVFVSLELSNGLFSQGLIKFENRRKTFYSSLQGLSFILFLCWLLIYFLFSDMINKILQLSTIQIISMLLIIWTDTIFSFWSISERVDFKYKKLITLTIIIIFLRPLVCIFFVTNSKDKVTARIIGMLLINLIVYGSLFIKQICKERKFFDMYFWKYALKFNIPLIPHYLATAILSGADRIMISKMIGAKETGIYSLAYSVSLIMTIFNNVLYKTVEPWLYINIKDKGYDKIAKIMYLLLILVGSLNILFISLAPEIIKIFAPKEYFEAIWIIPPVAMSVYFMFMYIFFAVFEFYYEKSKYIAFATFFGAFLNIILNYICINIWGYIAAGYTTLICYICYALLHFYFMECINKYYLKVEKIYDTKILILITSCFLSLGFIFLFSYTNSLLRYTMILIIIIIIFIYNKLIIKYINELIYLKKSI